MTLARAPSAPAHQRHELAPLTLGEPAEGLARGNTALREDLVDLDPPVLGHREQQIEHLGGEQIIWWPEQQFVDRLAAGFEVTLELRATAADVVGTLKRLHPLNERTFGGGEGLGERFADRRHGRRLYILRRGHQGKSSQVDITSSDA